MNTQAIWALAYRDLLKFRRDPRRIAPLRYAVDLVRGVFYAGQPDYSAVVLAAPAFNGAIIGALFAVFLVLGTVLFVRSERNR